MAEPKSLKVLPHISPVELDKAYRIASLTNHFNDEGFWERLATWLGEPEDCAKQLREKHGLQKKDTKEGIMPARVAEKVLKRRRVMDRTQYLVRWENSDVLADSWEDLNAATVELVAAFEEGNPTASDGEEDGGRKGGRKRKNSDVHHTTQESAKKPKKEKAEKAEKPEKAEKAEKAEKVEKAEKAEKPAKAAKEPKEPKEPKEAAEPKEPKETKAAAPAPAPVASAAAPAAPAPRAPGVPDVFEVEEIRDDKIEKGKKFYLIKWLGFQEKDNTWEPEDNIIDEALVRAYKERKAAASHEEIAPATTPAKKKKAAARAQPAATPMEGVEHTDSTPAQPAVSAAVEATPAAQAPSEHHAEATPTPAAKSKSEGRKKKEKDQEALLASAAAAHEAARQAAAATVSSEKPSSVKNAMKSEHDPTLFKPEPALPLDSFSSPGPLPLAENTATPPPPVVKVQERVGYDQGDVVQEVRGAKKDEHGTIFLYVAWKGRKTRSFVKASEVNERSPMEVIRFYESRLKFGDP